MKKVIFAAAVAGLFVAASCSSNVKTVTKGSLSEFDTLSYSVGVNLASMVKTQLADLPLDYDVLLESLISSALETNATSHEDATAVLQDYFQTKRQPRAMEVKKTRDIADSVALANGASEETVRAARASMTADAAMFESDEERALVSASLGNDLGASILNSKIPVQTVWVEKSFDDRVLEGELTLTEAEANAQIQKYFTVTLPAQNLAASEKWLASIEKKSGVQKTESGLLYKIEKKGNDVLAVDDRDVVRVKYTGKTRAGKVFDSSRYSDMDEQRKEQLMARNNGELPEDGEIIEFALNRVIKGWTEGMKLVGEGGRISLWIPSDLAYGPRGAGADIAANDALHFDVEIISVEKYVAPEPVAPKEVEEAEEK